MKRTFREIAKDAGYLLRTDIGKQKWAILIIAAYFFILRQYGDRSCPMVMITGFPCPACGLSRAGLSFLRGDFGLAFHTHPFIYPIIFLTLLFFVYRYIFLKSPIFLKKYLLMLIGLMIIYYVYRVIRYFPGEPPMSYDRRNLIRGFTNVMRSLT